MTPRPDPADELLSACHDGELTPSERAEVDRLLISSPALQETLDDFRELTAILQSLPRPAAPPALQADVLRRVQAAQPRPVTSARPRPWLWGLSLVATAALLLVVTRNRGPLERQDDHGVVAMQAPAAAPQDAPLARELTAPAAEGSSRSAAAAPAAEAIAAPAMTAALPPSPEPPAAPAPSLGGAPALLQSTAPSAAPTLNEAALSERLVLDPRHPPSASQILAYVDRVGDETVIVEFVVVDVERTAEDMLVLLQRRGLTVVGTDAAEAVAAKSIPADAAPPALVALYVEAPEQQLAALIDDVMSQVAVHDGTAFNADAAGPLMSRQLQIIEERYAAARGADRPAADRRRGSPAAPRREALADAAPAATPVETAPLTAPLDPHDEAPAQAVRLALPAAVYQQLEARDEAAAAAATRQPAGPLRGAAASAADSAAPAASPLSRVLFVLQREPSE